MPLTTLGQEIRWDYSTMLPSPRGAKIRDVNEARKSKAKARYYEAEARDVI